MSVGTGRFCFPTRDKGATWGKPQNRAGEVGAGRGASAYSLLARICHMAPRQQGSLGNGVRDGSVFSLM